jgi:RHS repeat-associated protein
VNADPDGDSTLFALNARSPGQYEDAETGWHYNRFRDYAPANGRYLQPDPLGFNNTLNIYSFADSDPINHYDPTGRGALGFAIGGTIGGALGTAIGGTAGGLGGAVGGGLATAGGGTIPGGIAGATWGAVEGGMIGTAIGAIAGDIIEDALPAIPGFTMGQNVGDSAIETDFGGAAADARLRGCPPPNRCDWLAEQAAKGLYSPERIRMQAKKWGCRGSRFFKGGKSR